MKNQNRAWTLAVNAAATAVIAINALAAVETGCSSTTGDGTSAGGDGVDASAKSGAPNAGGTSGAAASGGQSASAAGAQSTAGGRSAAAGGTTVATGGTSTATGGTTTAAGGAPATGGQAAGAGGANAGTTDISTDPNLKVAFIGDTSTGTTFRSVLNLVKAEAAAGLVVEGDMSYSADPAAWWADTEAVLGTSFPVFIARGNHDDSSWSGYLPTANNHLDGALREAGAHDANYKTTWRGLVMATIRLGDSPANITPFLENERHIWKLCSWHQNQAAMQVGGKGDEMGWEVYEACRKLGAIIETGHEHSYERTKTLTNMQTQTIDPSCASATALCVGLGRTFVNVVGLGGNSVRPQLRCLPATAPYGCNSEWAFIYTSDQNATFGAQFITFNAGDPNKATAYFKNINGNTVDNFTITYGK